MKPNSKFDLLKTTYPISKHKRRCDAYEFVLNNKEKLNKIGISINDLEEFIEEGEKYMYRVGKENGKFQAKYFSLKNFEILRKNWFIFED